jgi:hypothetical protein
MGELNNVEIDGYEPLLLATQEHFDLYWAQCIPLVDRVVTKAIYGEFTTDDIYNAAIQGQMYVFICKKDEGEYPDVMFVIIMELVNYPRLAALNVVVIGGSHLNPLFKKFWEKLCGWAYINGIRAIEALVSPAMARIISRFGFEHKYAQMRLNLNED